jgi:hypothetical protein
MGTKENRIINQILCEMPENQRLFRINAGVGWTGKMASTGKLNMIVLENARPLRAAPKGWPDLTGWTSIEVTPDMVGQKVAVFTGIEVKASGKVTDIQESFGSLLKRMGGIHKVLDGSGDDWGV